MCPFFLLQNELDSMATIWNNHAIRESRRNLPSGRPNVMYELPCLYNTRSYITQMTQAELQQYRNLSTPRSSIPCDENMHELCCHIMSNNHLRLPDTTEEAVDLYLHLRNTIRNALSI